MARASRATDNGDGAAEAAPAPGQDHEVAQRPWAPMGDAKERAAVVRSRRWGLLLMALSSAAAIALLAGAWLLVRQSL